MLYLVKESEALSACNEIIDYIESKDLTLKDYMILFLELDVRDGYIADFTKDGGNYSILACEAQEMIKKEVQRYLLAKIRGVNYDELK